MKAFTWAVIFPALLTGSALGAKFPLSSLRGAKALPGNVVPNRFVVEVESPSDIPTKRDIFSREVSSLHSRILCMRAFMLSATLSSHTRRYTTPYVDGAYPSTLTRNLTRPVFLSGHPSPSQYVIVPEMCPYSLSNPHFFQNANVSPSANFHVCNAYADLQDRQKIAQMSGVKAVRPVIQIPAPQ